LILCITFVLISSKSYAQSEEKKPQVIKGKVINSEDTTAAAFIHVINQNMRKVTNTDEEGRFNIYAEEGDTLIFSGVQYVQDTLVLTPLPDQEKIIAIALQPTTLVMDEVEINELPPLDVFKRQVLNYRPEKEERIHIPGSYNGPRKEHDFGKGGPFSLIAGMFSKEVKEFRKMKRIREREGRNAIIEQKYNRQFISRVTELEGKRLDEFMVFCNFDEDFLYSSNEYEIILAIQEKLEEFEKKDSELLPDGMPMMEKEIRNQG
jgi:hypothetical protein